MLSLGRIHEASKKNPGKTLAAGVLLGMIGVKTADMLVTPKKNPITNVSVEINKSVIDYARDVPIEADSGVVEIEKMQFSEILDLYNESFGNFITQIKDFEALVTKLEGMGAGSTTSFLREDVGGEMKNLRDALEKEVRDFEMAIKVMNKKMLENPDFKKKEEMSIALNDAFESTKEPLSELSKLFIRFDDQFANPKEHPVDL